MFSLQELVVSAGFSEIKVEVGATFLFVKNCSNYLYNYWLKMLFPTKASYRCIFSFSHPYYLGIFVSSPTKYFNV